MKKFLLGGLSLVLLIGGLTGCGKKTEPATDDTQNEAQNEVIEDLTNGQEGENNTVVEEEPTEIVSSYNITNTTGENVIELFVFIAGTDDRSLNLAGEAGLADGESVLVDENTAEIFKTVLSGEDAANDNFVLEFTTESGHTGRFETLHREVANINLLSVDEAAGATQIAFTM